MKTSYSFFGELKIYGINGRGLWENRNLRVRLFPGDYDDCGVSIIGSRRVAGNESAMTCHWQKEVAEKKRS